MQTEALRKANEQTQRQAKEQMDAASKVNADLQKQLEQQGKTLLDMQNQQKVQQTEFNKSLEKCKRQIIACNRHWGNSLLKIHRL